MFKIYQAIILVAKIPLFREIFKAINIPKSSNTLS